MHEMALVQRAVDIVLEECHKRGVRSVKTVHLAIGELSDVVEDFIPDLFRFLAKDTPAQGAAVEINRIPARVRCSECGEIFGIDLSIHDTHACPRCHAPGRYRLFSGREFQVEGIECEAC